MKLFPRFSRRSKVMLGAVLTVVAAATIAVPAVTHADLEGANRPTKAYVQGMAGFDHVQFNSFTGVPGVGDERQFMSGRLSTSTGAFYDSMEGVSAGQEITVEVYVHNNADTSLNASGVGVARNTRVRVALPTGLATSQTAQAFISADNATPQAIEDDFPVSGNSQFGLQYVPGSAHIKTNFQDVALSDDIVSANGTLVGDNNLKGDFPGCFEHAAYITMKVKVVTPSFSLEKDVRMSGTTAWQKQVAAKSGDKVDFVLGFHNNGTTPLNQVVVGDRMPVGLTYVPGTTYWYSSLTNNQWSKVSDDGWMAGGITLGTFAPDSGAFVKFTATVDDASKLQCGLNRITNIGFGHPANEGTVQGSAEVDVTKTCQTPTPVFSCDLLEVTSDNVSRTVTVKTMNTTATDGAVLKSVDLNWGETGVPTLNTDHAVGTTHTYKAESGNGPFTITATGHFSTPTSNDTTATSANCVKQVSFTTATPVASTTPTTPTELVNTGSGNIFGLFAAVTVLGAIVHRLFLGRAFGRR